MRSGGINVIILFVVDEYKTGGSTKHRLLSHVVFCPKFRRRVLIGRVSRRINELFTEACEINDWGLHELNIQKDHVHMLLQINPREGLSKAVQILKGGSSYIIRKEFPKLEEFLWGKSFWADGFFAESVGQKNEKAIRDYIKNQNNKKRVMT